MRTAVLAAAMSSAPLARPVVALLPPAPKVKPMIEVTAEYVAVPASEAYDEIIAEAARLFEMDADLIHAVMEAESSFHPYAVSRAGAEGLMQLMPELSDEMGVGNAFDPRQNIMGGARYLQVLARRFCKTPAATDPQRPNERLTVCSTDEKVKVVAAYHAGPGAVEKYGGVPPYETTRWYVAMVMKRYEQYRVASTSASER